MSRVFEGTNYAVWFVRSDGDHESVMICADLQSAQHVCNALRVHYHDDGRSYIVQRNYHGNAKVVY